MSHDDTGEEKAFKWHPEPQTKFHFLIELSDCYFFILVLHLIVKYIFKNDDDIVGTRIFVCGVGDNGGCLQNTLCDVWCCCAPKHL